MHARRCRKPFREHLAFSCSIWRLMRLRGTPTRKREQLTWFLSKATRWPVWSKRAPLRPSRLAWAGLWYRIYRDPDQNQRLSTRERDFIRAGGGWVDGQVGSERRFALNLADLRFVLTQRRLWGMYLGQFALNAVPWFFLTWFPTYLVTYRHFDFIREGIFSSLPFLAAVCGVIAGGVSSDFLVRRGVSPSVARKTPVIAGMILSASVVGANFVNDPKWIMFFLATSE